MRTIDCEQRQGLIQRNRLLWGKSAGVVPKRVLARDHTGKAGPRVWIRRRCRPIGGIGDIDVSSQIIPQGMTPRNTMLTQQSDLRLCRGVGIPKLGRDFSNSIQRAEPAQVFGPDKGRMRDFVAQAAEPIGPTRSLNPVQAPPNGVIPDRVHLDGKAAPIQLCDFVRNGFGGQQQDAVRVVGFTIVTRGSQIGLGKRSSEARCNAVEEQFGEISPHVW